MSILSTVQTAEAVDETTYTMNDAENKTSSENKLKEIISESSESRKLLNSVSNTTKNTTSACDSDLNSDQGLSSSTTASCSASEEAELSTAVPPVNVWKLRMERVAKVKETDDQKIIQKAKNEDRDANIRQREERDRILKEELAKEEEDGFVKVLPKSARSKRNSIHRHSSMTGVKQPGANQLNNSIGNGGSLKKHTVLNGVKNTIVTQKAAAKSTGNISNNNNQNVPLVVPKVTPLASFNDKFIKQQKSTEQHQSQQVPTSSSTQTINFDSVSVSAGDSKTENSITDSDESVGEEVKPSLVPAKIVLTIARSENVARTSTSNPASLSPEHLESWPTLGSQPSPKPVNRPQKESPKTQSTAPKEPRTTTSTTTSKSKTKTFIPLDLSIQFEKTARSSTPSRGGRGGRTGRGRGGRGAASSTSRAHRASISGPSAEEVPEGYMVFDQRRSEGHIQVMINGINPHEFMYEPIPPPPVLPGVVYPIYGVNTEELTADTEHADLDTVRLWLRQQIEFYFSIENLCRDLFIRNQMSTETGAVPLSLLASFPRVRTLINLAKSKYIHNPPALVPVVDHDTAQSPVDTDSTLAEDTGCILSTPQPLQKPPPTMHQLKMDTESPLWLLELILTSIANSIIVEILPSASPFNSIADVHIRKKDGWMYWILGEKNVQNGHFSTTPTHHY